MKKILILLTFIFQNFYSFSQAFTERTYTDPGNRRGIDIKQTYDGGFILLGSAYDPVVDFDSLVLTKIDEWGNVQWSKIYGEEFYDWDGMKIIPTIDSSFLVVGSGMGPNGYSPLIKFNSIGDTILCKDVPMFGGPFFTDGAQLQDTGYIMLNTFYSTLVRLNSAGDTIWTKQCTQNFNNYGSALLVSTNSYVIVGSQDSLISICKTDTSGQIMWRKEWYIGDHPFPVTIEQTIDSGYVIMGQMLNNASQWFNMIVKTDSMGDTLWTRLYPNNYALYTRGIVTQDNGFLIGTLTDTSNNAIALKFDSLGNFDWSFEFGNLTAANSICEIDSNNFAIVGDADQIGANMYFARTGIQTHVENINLKSQAVVYPNPVVDKVFFQTDINGYKVIITDITGKKIIERNKMEVNYIDVRELKPSTYFYTLVRNEKAVFSGSFIKIQ